MLDFLKPVSDHLQLFVNTLPSHAIGNNITLHTKEEFPEFIANSIAVFTVNETRNNLDIVKDDIDFEGVRKQFYKLAKGDWNINLMDLGEVSQGESIEDTYYLVTKLVEELLEAKCIPVIIGGGQDIAYANYRAYSRDNGMVNLVNVDAGFDLGNVELPITNQSYVGKIVVDQPYNLFNYTNIGYQSYYVAPEELDLIERMFFDTYRLGEISNDLTLAEPAMRDADIVTVDLNALEATFYGENPNGFSGKELCALSRYAGISDKVSSFGIYEYISEKCTVSTNQLVSQLIWYFIEGVSARWGEKGGLSNMDVTHYQVPIDNQILSFYKSNITDRWWIEIDASKKIDNNLSSIALLPCTYNDYISACNQNIPERWFNAKIKYEM